VTGTHCPTSPLRLPCHFLLASTPDRLADPGDDPVPGLGRGGRHLPPLGQPDAGEDQPGLLLVLLPADPVPLVVEEWDPALGPREGVVPSVCFQCQADPWDWRRVLGRPGRPRLGGPAGADSTDSGLTGPADPGTIRRSGRAPSAVWPGSG
jgi:hypothetical protein